MKYRILIIVFLFFSGCEDLLDLRPEQSLPTEEALSDLSGLETATRGAYSLLRQLGYYGRNFYVSPVAAGDNILISLSNSGRFIDINRYNLNPFQTQTGLWNAGYNILAQVNNVIENIDNIDINQEDEKNNILVQVYFIRALVNFDLARTFCQPWIKGNGSQLGIPIVLKTEIGTPPRNTLAEVYDHIINDLTLSIAAFDAIRDPEKSWSPPFFASKIAAQALLSRVYLYKEDNENAEAAASAVINSNTQLVARNSYVSYWNSEVLTDPGIGRFIEDIFVLRVLNVESLGAEDLGLIYMVEGFGDLRPTEDILSLLPSNDIRRELIRNIGGDDYIYKFPGRTNFPGLTSPRILRLSEIYLNRAEARAKMGDLTGATSDLNQIRTRAGLPAISPTAGEILSEVLLERRKELAFEGHRSFDIFRNGLDLVRQECNLPNDINCMVPFSSHLTAYPIPIGEIRINPNMVQTEGY